MLRGAERVNIMLGVERVNVVGGNGDIMLSTNIKSGEG